MAVRRVALVTGAARGIGAATVALLDQAGWAVVALDPRATTRDFLTRWAPPRSSTAVSAAGYAVAVRGDATDPDIFARAVQVAEERFGGLDAVVAAAGVVAGGVPLWEVPLEQEQAVLDVNLHAALVAARLGIPALLRRPAPRHGRLLVVASAAATRGLPMLAAYCAANAGVSGLVRALAVELRGTGVTANAVLPVDRDKILDESARLYNLDSAEAFAAQQPLARLLEPEEVAAALVWLAGPDGAASLAQASRWTAAWPCSSYPPDLPLEFDHSTRTLGEGTGLLGGQPTRYLRLTRAGAEVKRRLLDAGAGSDKGAQGLARRLVNAGLAHPRPAPWKPERSHGRHPGPRPSKRARRVPSSGRWIGHRGRRRIDRSTSHLSRL